MSEDRSVRRRRVCLPLALATLLSTVAAPAMATTVSSSSARDLAQVARSVARGASMRIEDMQLDGQASPSALDLVRFEPVADHARFVLQTADGPRAAHVDVPTYLRGSVDGMLDSIVVLSVRASGEVRGVVSGADGTWMLARELGADRLHSRRLDRQASAGAPDFSCEVLPNPGPARSAATAPALRSASPPLSYTAQISVELDDDYYLTFAPDAGAAILYALDLMAFTGTLAQAELGMNVQVPFVQLWTTASDPYSGSGTTRLQQVRSRWNTAGATNCGGSDCTTIARSTVVLLSSAPTGGVGYMPGLCDSWHSPTNGYSYAYVGSINGGFDIQSPAAVWDVIATTHELGHNFGSSHTHCYNPPVDDCYNNEPNCYAGPTQLPSGCPGSGQGCGTIMSYCHLLGGGMANMSLTYGAGHPYGDTPQRVPDAMMSRIAIEAAAAPGCLAPTDGLVEVTVARTGTGGGVVTSSPAGIDCGYACRTYFDAATAITLTPTPDAFSTFAGWSGDADCSDGVVTPSTATTCTAIFNGSCGAAHDDCDDADPCTTDSCPGGDHCEHAAIPRDPSTCFHAGKAGLKIIRSADGSSNDKMSWLWGAGAAFAQADLGSPSTGTDYALCVYDATAGVARLAMSLSIPAGSPNWASADPRGWSWSDSAAAFDGIRKLQLRTGLAGRTKVKLMAAGTALPLPVPFSTAEYFDQDPSVVVQLLTSDNRCWTSSFASSGSNTPLSFSAAGN